MPIIAFPLTDQERDFLAAFIYEATTDPFGGPATDDLHNHGIYHSDIRSLMAAYYQERNPDQEGFGGKKNPAPPPCPWPSKGVAECRDRELQPELNSATRQPVS